MNELTMTLASRNGTPLYEQIYLYIKENIVSGKFAYHEKLPSTRALAKHLEVSRSTVDLAYEQLLSEGYIESEPYRGYYVAQIEGLYQIREVKKRQTPEVREKEETCRYDFTPNGVDLKSFPHNAWRKLSKEILLDDEVELFRPTCNTPRTICSAFPISSYFYTVLRANILALPTSGAEFFIKGNLWIRTDGLRIAAPRAMQITSLQKYIGSDSFSIMYMEMFYVEYDSICSLFYLPIIGTKHTIHLPSL